MMVLPKIFPKTRSCSCLQGMTHGQLAMNPAFLSSSLAVTTTTEPISWLKRKTSWLHHLS